jgi:DNA-binding NtrC family response regulator
MEAICDSILQRIEQRMGTVRLLTPDAMDRLRQYGWPGNIRELSNILEKMAMLSEKKWLSGEDLEGILPRYMESRQATAPVPGDSRSYADAIETFEREFLSNALSAAHGKVDDAARNLGLARATLYRKLKSHGLLSQERDTSHS